MSGNKHPYAVEQIRNINRISPSHTPYNSIKHKYSNLLTNIRVTIKSSSSTQMLFRARVVGNSKKPNCISEFLAPPVELVTGYQRCNAPGKPTFYAASTRLGALLECRAKTNDIVYLTQWMVRERIPVNEFLFPESSNLLEGVYTENELATYSHLDTIFTRRIHNDYSDDYKFTCAVSEMMMNGFRENSALNVDSSKEICLRYPSAFHASDSYNFAMSGQFAKKRLSILHVMELEVLEVRDSNMVVSVRDNATTFRDPSKYGDRPIDWTGDPCSVPSLNPEKTKVLFMRDGAPGGWKLRTEKQPVSPALLNVLIHEPFPLNTQ